MSKYKPREQLEKRKKRIKMVETGENATKLKMKACKNNGLTKPYSGRTRLNVVYTNADGIADFFFIFGRRDGMDQKKKRP